MNEGPPTFNEDADSLTVTGVPAPDLFCVDDIQIILKSVKQELHLVAIVELAEVVHWFFISGQCSGVCRTGNPFD